MTLTLALDWTPNVLHAGILWAEAKNLYAQAGLSFSYISTEIDNYARKPIDRLQDSEADLAIGPTEHLFFYNAAGHKPHIQAVATIMQPNMSAFVARQSNVARPRELNEQTYLCYNTPLEKEIISEVIKGDGGKGHIKAVSAPRLDVWQSFIDKAAATTWVFIPWEVQLAKQANVALSVFKPNDYGVPYGYSTLFFAKKELSEDKQKAIKLFLKITDEGYRQAAHHPKETAKLLSQKVQHRNFGNPELIHDGVLSIAPALLNTEGNWGEMEHQRFEKYAQWLSEKQLVHDVWALRCLCQI